MPTKTKKPAKSSNQLVNKLAKRPLSVPTVIGVLVLAVAIGGYLIYKSFASSMTSLGTANNVSVYACKTYSNAFGGVYKVTVRFTKPSPIINHYYSVTTWRPADVGSVAVSTVGGNQYLNYVLAQEIVNASIPLKDQLGVYVHDTASANSGDQAFYMGPNTSHAWSRIANC